MAKVVCAGWADDRGPHPCGIVLRHTNGQGVSHGVCSSCFSLQLEHMGMLDGFIGTRLKRDRLETPAG
jgi:hypothetical protein